MKLSFSGCYEEGKKERFSAGSQAISLPTTQRAQVRRSGLPPTLRSPSTPTHRGTRDQDSTLVTFPQHKEEQVTGSTQEKQRTKDRCTVTRLETRLLNGLNTELPTKGLQDTSGTGLSLHLHPSLQTSVHTSRRTACPWRRARRSSASPPCLWGLYW